jgi:peptide/nickel transport system substrate-binding protein
MKHRWSRWILLLVAGLLVSACAGGVTTTESPTAPPAAATQAAPNQAMPTPGSTEPQVLKVATTANVTTWDPIKSFSTEALYMGNIYEQLLRINPPGASKRFTPLLAESWETSPDGLVWTFHLRPNVKFHDGEPLTAEAVKLSIEAAKDRSGASFIWAPLKTIDVVDNQTVRFNLSYAAPLDLIASSLYGAWIVSPKLLKASAADEKYFDKPIAAGTGPYQLETMIPDKEILLTRFDGYWGGWNDVRHFDKVQVLITPDSDQQQRMLENGKVDLALQMPMEKIGAFRTKPGYTFVEEPSFFNYVGFFNTLRPPLDNKLVRQALSYAIPYDDIIAIGAQGYGTQSRGPVPAGVWPYSENIDQYAHDLEKARALLKEAGHPGGGFKLKLTYAAENQNEQRFAPLIKEAFAKIGVEVELAPMPFKDQWAQAKTNAKDGQDIFIVLYWPTYSDAGTDNLWSLFHSSEKPSFNLSYWANTDFDTLIDDAAKLTVSDPATALKKYEDAMSLLADEAPGIFFYDTKAVYAIPERIKGYQYNLNYPFTQFFYPLYTE